MRKNLFFIFISLILTFEMVGCGIVKKVKSSPDITTNSKTETTTNAEITTDNINETEEITINDSEESNEEVIVHSTSHDIADYWQGSDYFDLEGYVTARGGVDYKVEECSSNGYYAGGYGAFFNYNGWEITIPFIYEDNSFCKGTDIVFENSSTYVYVAIPTMTTPIRVDSNGNTISRDTEDVLMMILNEIDTYTGLDKCPCCEAGHSWGETYSKGTSYNHVCLMNH